MFATAEPDVDVPALIRSHAVARIAERTHAQQTMLISDCCYN